MQPVGPCRERQETLSRNDRHTLYAYKIKRLDFRPFNLKAQLNCFLNSQHEFVKRLCLSVASGQRGYGRHQESVGVALYQYVKFACHFSLSQSLRQSRHRRQNHCKGAETYGM